MGYPCKKQELVELDDDNKQGLTEKNRNTVNVLQNIMRQMHKLDDLQEENLNLVRNDISNFVKEDNSPFVRQYLRDIETYMTILKKDLWKNPESRDGFKKLLMSAAAEVMDNQNLSSDDFIKINLEKDSDLAEDHQALAAHLQNL